MVAQPGGVMPPTSTISLLINNPFAPDFRPPKATTAKELTNYVVARQLVAYKQAFDIPYKVMLKQINVLLKKYGVDLTQRGIVAALNVAEHPFSAKFIEKYIQELKQSQPYHYQTGVVCQLTTLNPSEPPTMPNKSCATSK